jgi:magnesium-transporting ATPase (P-type)
MLLIVYYSHKSTPIYVRILVFISFTVTFVSFMILPLDIYENSKISQEQETDDEKYEHLDNIQTLWTVIFYINFWGCWILLPFFQEFEDSGEFTFKLKLKDALKMNALLISALCIGATLIVIYLTIFRQFTLIQLPSVFSMLVNLFGMLLVTLALGFGFVSLPKEFYLKRDYKRLVNICHRSAENLKNEEE